MKNLIRTLAIVTGFLPDISSAQTYTVGDVISDVALTDYRTGESTSLYALGAEGGVLVLEWFAWWCPFCASAAANVETGIIQHYGQSNNLNPNGVPVKHIALNVQGNARANSDAFIAQYGITTVMEDYSRDFFRKFSPSGGQPLFVILNAEPNSPSAARWQVIYTRLNYLGNAAPDISALMRPVIDAVQPGVDVNPPSLRDGFPELPADASGWQLSSWFGWIHVDAYPFLQHRELGWVYAIADPESDNIHLYDFDQGWLYSGPSIFPFMYASETQAWSLYQDGSYVPL